MKDVRDHTRDEFPTVRRGLYLSVETNVVPVDMSCTLNTRMKIRAYFDR